MNDSQIPLPDKRDAIKNSAEQNILREYARRHEIDIWNAARGDCANAREDFAARRCPKLRVDGIELRVRGLDAVDGTPILDVKPFMREFEPTVTHQPAWVTELMKGYY